MCSKYQMHDFLIFLFTKFGILYFLSHYHMRKENKRIYIIGTFIWQVYNEIYHAQIEVMDVATSLSNKIPPTVI